MEFSHNHSSRTLFYQKCIGASHFELCRLFDLQTVKTLTLEEHFWNKTFA